MSEVNITDLLIPKEKQQEFQQQQQQQQFQQQQFQQQQQQQQQFQQQQFQQQTDLHQQLKTEQQKLQLCLNKAQQQQNKYQPYQKYKKEKERKKQQKEKKRQETLNNPLEKINEKSNEFQKNELEINDGCLSETKEVFYQAREFDPSLLTETFVILQPQQQFECNQPQQYVEPLIKDQEQKQQQCLPQDLRHHPQDNRQQHETQHQQQHHQQAQHHKQQKQQHYYSDDCLSFPYLPKISPLNVIINRSKYSDLPEKRQTYIHTYKNNSTLRGSLPENLDLFNDVTCGIDYVGKVQRGVEDAVEKRGREKKEMRGLNERLAGYIEKVRFLEAQNKKLAKEISDLIRKWGSESRSIKVMYDRELIDARGLLDEADKEKAKCQLEKNLMQEQLEEAMDRIRDLSNCLSEERIRNNDLENKMADQEAILFYTKRKCLMEKEEKEGALKEADRLRVDVEQLREGLDAETLLHLESANKARSLKEEMEFMKMLHDQELRELAGLISRDDTMERREYWKNEVNECLKELKALFDKSLKQIEDDMRENYGLQISEKISETDRLKLENEGNLDDLARTRQRLNDLHEKIKEMEEKNIWLIREMEREKRDKEFKEEAHGSVLDELKRENSKLRAELQALLFELDKLNDDNINCRLELEAYHKIVQEEQGEKHVYEHQATMTSEERSRPQKNNNNNNNIVTSSSRPSSSSISKDLSSKTTVQKSSKGPLMLSHISLDGTVVVVSNTGLKSESLSGWSLERKIDSLPKLVFKFGDDASVSAEEDFKIWSEKSGKRPDQLPANEKLFRSRDWGFGANVVTVLLDQNKQERSRYVQSCKYA